jgi:DNA-binding MarR family transcriptional regulator
VAAESEFPTTGYLVWRLSTRFRAAADRALAPLGLTHAQYALLASLYGLSRGGARPSQRELSDFSGLEPMYVSKLARALERAGLVTRPQSRVDPRAFSLTLTQRGEDLAARAIAVIVALQDELTGPIGGRRSARNRELIATLQTLLNAEEEDMTQTAPLTGQDIGEAAAAIRVLLDEQLEKAGLLFEDWVVLRTLARAGGRQEREALLRGITQSLRTDRSGIDDALARLEEVGLVNGTDDVGLTTAGHAVYGRLQEAVGQVSAQVYDGLDRDDLATTRHVLHAVRERALAMAGAGSD